MTLWLVRAGRHGEREDFALEQGIAIIGWDDLPDLSKVRDRSALTAILATTHANEGPKTRMNWESQIWPFRAVMERGDWVVLPLKRRPFIAVGRIAGDYTYLPHNPGGARHTRPVDWIGEFPRTAFDQDLLFSFGAFMTVCRVRRNEAERRVAAIAGAVHSPPSMDQGLLEADRSEANAEPVDLEAVAQEHIRRHIGQKFAGHKLAELVAAILQAQGYWVRTSPPGADGGVDILAGRGPLGFDPPRLAAQVKSGESPSDVKLFRELRGAMQSFGASQGLFVSWGGYRGAIEAEASRHFFDMRLWGPEELIEAVQAHYADLPEAIQAELPLKPVWMLIPEIDR